MKTPKEKWIWMPHPAHLIISASCQFHLATKIGRHIVSTVGEYWPDSQVRKIHLKVHNEVYPKDQKVIEGIGDEWDRNYMKAFGFDDIGFNRKYETMVFKAKKSPEKGCKACIYVIESGRELDMDGYNKPEDAFKGHLKMCLKWANK